MQQGAQSKAKDNKVTDEKVNEQHSDESDSHSHESHEDYFERQQKAFGTMHITEKTVFRARKKEYFMRKRMKECLSSFQNEHQLFNILIKADDRDVQFNRKIVKNEVIEMADRIEIMEQSLKKQQEAIQRQELAFKDFSTQIVKKLDDQQAMNPVKDNGMNK